ncbi:transposable element Tcb2 transposase [Trichonephila clavipes]|nr:transposable element Tcb2 transposase [Trichonephila clavipes]
MPLESVEPRSPWSIKKVRRACLIGMSLRRCRSQYEQLQEGMMEAGWSSRLVGRSDLTVRRCWDQWTEEASFTRQSGSGRPLQTSHREDHHVIRYASVQPTASLATEQTHAAPSLRAPVTSRTIARRLAEGHPVSRCPLRVLPMTPTHPPTDASV